MMGLYHRWKVLKPGAFKLYVFFVSRQVNGQVTGLSIRAVANLAAMDPGSVAYALKQLRDLEFVTVTSGHGRRASVYTLNVLGDQDGRRKLCNASASVTEALEGASHFYTEAEEPSDSQLVYSRGKADDGRAV